MANITKEELQLLMDRLELAASVELPHDLALKVFEAAMSSFGLLEALEGFLRCPAVGSDGPGSITLRVMTFNLDAARAAIAKARGEL